MRAVIIEKDEEIRQEIEKILIKVDSDYELLGMAENGQAGYEMISTLHPNLVILDIQLPRMNGMSMLRKLRYEGYKFRAVVITKEENFLHAKQAIELGVDGYLLKPIRPINLKKVLMQIKEKMRNDYWRDTSFNVENLLMVCMYGQLQMDATLNEITVRNYGFALDGRCGVLNISVESAYEENKEEIVRILKRVPNRENRFLISVFALDMTKEIFAIVYQAADYGELEVYFQTTVIPLVCNNITSEMVFVWQEAERSIDLWKIKQRQPAMRQWNLVLRRGELISESKIKEINPLPLTYPVNLEMQVREAVISGQKKEVRKCFNRLREVLCSKQHDPEEVKAHLIRFSLAVANAYRAKREISSEAVLMDLTMGLGQAVSWNKIEQSIDEFLNQLSFDTMRLGQTREFSPMVQKAAEMARKYFDQGLTLEETASQLYVSEEYLSTQFKKETGVGFTETVRRYRIEKIKELLLGTKLKLNQISELVGYSDPKYMSKVFKEETGMLPSEYRKNIN